MQPTLFDVGRAQLPPRVLVFASGVNEAREIRGFSLARIPVGFSARHVRGEAIAELQRSELPLFADSGAFSEVALTAAGLVVVHPISHQEWSKRLSLYQLLAERHGSNLSVVVPDRVADQEHTLLLLARYREELEALAKTGARLLIPVQRGALTPETFLQHALEVAGVPMSPALPMKKAGMSHGEVLAFLQIIRPAHVHLLGMGFERERAKRLVRLLLNSFEALTVSLDSNRLRAVAGHSRSMTAQERTYQATPVSRLYGEVDHPALAGSRVNLDYTEAIAFPSMWAGAPELERIASEACLAHPEEFLGDPDGFLQQETEGRARWEWPVLSAVLDRAWSRYVGTLVKGAVRTAAISTTFTNAQIAQ